MDAARNDSVPELPEVETIRRQLEPEIVGRRITQAAVLDPRWTEPVPSADVERNLVGRRIEAVERRGKWLMLRLDDATTLIMHLRMTGNVVLGGPDRRYLRAEFRLDDGRDLLFTDARRFGTGAVVGEGQLEAFFADRA